MLVNLSEIRAKLIADLDYDYESKSSHWKHHTKDALIDDSQRIKGINGFSLRSKKFPLSKFLHERAQRKTFPEFRTILDSNWYKSAQLISKKQRRSLDVCTLRHVYTLDFLDRMETLNEISNNGKGVVCVIGDGQANFVSLAISDNRFNKVISVNLTEVLLSDLDLLEDIGFGDNFCRLAESRAEYEILLHDKTTRVILVRATDSHILHESQIDLFINIASFQEMKRATVDSYFRIIKSNSAYLYCCNRESKTLYGGETLVFNDYPWEDSKVLIHETCPWHLTYYDFRSPKFFRSFPYDGLILHRLVKFR